MRDLVEALKKKEVKGVQDIRAFKGFFMGTQSNNIFEIKFDGKWMPMTNPVFESRKELNSKVKDIKKYWKEKSE